MRALAVVVAALALTACNRDPNYLKQKYLESGNKFSAAKRYKEASIMYRKSLEKDRRFGPAWYHLALTDLSLGQVADAVRALRSAVELLPPGTADADDASLKLAEIEILAASAQQNNPQLVEDIQQIRDGILKRNPNSWRGHKISGDLDMLAVSTDLRKGQAADAKPKIADAVAEYRKALAAKGGNDPTITLALGHALEGDGQVDEAQTMFRALVTRDKNNLQGYSELYRIYAARKQPDQAEAVLKEAIQNNPKDASSRMALARFYLATGKKDQLISLLDEMKGNLKDFPQAYVFAGDFYVSTRQPDQAIKEYQEGIAKDPKQKATYLKHEVQAYLVEGKVNLASDTNEQILKDNPKDADAQELEATFMLDKGSIDKAMQELQAVVTASPSNFMAHFNLGRAHFLRAEYEQSRQEFAKTIQLRPDYTPARLAITQVAIVQGDNEQALRDAEDVLKVAPNSIQGHVMEASALERLGRMSEAETLLNSVLDKLPNQPEALLEMGVLRLNEKKYKDAEQAFAKAWAAQPRNLRGLLGESAAYRMDGQAAKSVQVVSDEAAKDPSRLDLQVELGNVQMAAGQFDTAIQTFNAALGKTNDARVKGNVLTQIAEAYRLKHDTPDSIAALEKANKNVPNNTGILTNLGELYSEQTDYKTSRQYYESALKIDPNNPIALNNLAFLLADTNGDLDLALTYATRAKQRMPDHTEITDTLGWIYLKKKLTDNALDTFRQLVAQAPQNPTYHYHYAIALSQKGDKNTARRECQQALDDKPNQHQEQEIRRFMQQIS